MPAPQAAQLKSQAVALYGQQLGAEAQEYLDALFGEVSKAWDMWSKGITFGTLTAVGAGVGAWSGVGSGGAMSGQSFSMAPFSFKGNSAQQLKFTKGLADALKQKFTMFPATFKFSPVQFAGSSAATPIAPGPVSAVIIPATMMMAGAGQNPSGIADLWKSSLTPPEFKLDDPNAKSGDLIKAIAGSIEQSFQSVWLATTMVQTNSLNAAGAPGGVVAGFPTGMDGKLV
jgi:hypothetical protein